MEQKFLSEWNIISTAVRAAVMTGNYGWVAGFGKAYYAVTKKEFTCESLKSNMAFAVEPIAPPKGHDIHMLIFFPNGHCYEAKLLNDSGRVLFMWINTTDYKTRPLLTTTGRIKIPTGRPDKVARTEQAIRENEAAPQRKPRTKPANNDNDIEAGCQTEPETDILTEDETEASN